MNGAARPLRVGLFGLLGAGNLGNDGSLEAVLTWLRERHPHADIDFWCSGPEEITARYGLPATRMSWNTAEHETASSARAIAWKVLTKGVDALRTLRWVGRHDLVVVPGMGVLEATLPIRPWGFPLSLLILTAAGRLTRRTVALVSVGANADGGRWTRRVLTTAARLAGYRSYRDELSRTAMQRSGLDVSHDAVFPDLVFALPAPAVARTPTGTVAVGVMNYHGTEDERGVADEVREAYVAKVVELGRWLLDEGHRVRLVTGDRADEPVADRVAVDLRAYRSDLGAGWVRHEPVDSLAGLTDQLAQVDTVVATRYHNVLCAVRLSKPTISLGYSAKNDVLMAEMGLAEFCQPVQTLDVHLLTEQLAKLGARDESLTDEMDRRIAVNYREAWLQFDQLSALLLAR